MPLFNFQKQFADAVERGEKRQTIRARRKIRPQAYQIAYLYTGARTKACRKLGEYKIKSVTAVFIGQTNLAYGKVCFGERYNKPAMDSFAKSDGFNDWNDMRDWFLKNHGLPFKGDLIQW